MTATSNPYRTRKAVSGTSPAGQQGSLLWLCTDHGIAKPSEKTLSELDRYRYGDAIDQFGGDTPKKQMGLEDVKMLVSWKL